MVGLSGGVDSSVAAALLQEQGHEVSGLFMKNWEEDDHPGYCAAAADLADAEAVCNRLGIPLHTANFSYEYWQHVFSRLLDEYRAGRTPNPDVLCNREIKFKEFLARARTLGAEQIATGHYARIEADETAGHYTLHKGMDADKDQSYFLHQIPCDALPHSRFPLGGLHKPEVRRLAKKLGLPTHAKRDSTGLCFIGERPFREFLSGYLPAQPGEIRSLEGKVLGEHQGAFYYTIGQRHGLGLGGQGEPWYVAQKDIERNRLYVVQGRDHPKLYTRRARIGAINWIGAAPQQPHACAAKVRYRQPDAACTLLAPDAENRQWVEFNTPQWAVTPGQSLVLYQGEQCLGGALIEDCE